MEPNPGGHEHATVNERVTSLIELARAGDTSARDRLFETVYAEMKLLAQSTPYAGRTGATLQPTVLVNEVYIEFRRRFPPPPKSMPESRRTFYQSVAFAMRQIVRDHWRASTAAKRGGGSAHLPIEPDHPAPSLTGGALDALALDEALDDLERFNTRWHEVVLHRYFTGRTLAETAEMMGLAPSTVSQDWQLARAWLVRRLGG